MSPCWRSTSSVAGQSASAPTATVLRIAMDALTGCTSAGSASLTVGVPLIGSPVTLAVLTRSARRVSLTCRKTTSPGCMMPGMLVV